jgi:hypothetical protein
MSCFDKIAIELQWVAPYIQWACSLEFMAYKYSDLQMSNAIQKLSYKVNYKLPIFLIVILTFLGQLSLNPDNSFMSCCSFGFQHCTKGILGGMSTQSWDKGTSGVPTFTCSFPPLLLRPSLFLRVHRGSNTTFPTTMPNEGYKRTNR